VGPVVGIVVAFWMGGWFYESGEQIYYGPTFTNSVPTGSYCNSAPTGGYTNSVPTGNGPRHTTIGSVTIVWPQ
jgi:hypothetical protein